MGILVLMILFFTGFPMVCAMMAVAYDIKNPTPKGYYTVNEEGKIVRNPELEEEETKKVLIPENIKKRGQTRSTQRMDAKVTEVRVKDNTVKKIVLENGKIVYQSEEEKAEDNVQNNESDMKKIVGQTIKKSKTYYKDAIDAVNKYTRKNYDDPISDDDDDDDDPIKFK